MQDEVDQKQPAESQPEQQTATIPPINVTIQQPITKRRIGKKRSILAPLLLPIVTLGIYSLVWLYKVYSEADYYCEGRVNVTSGGAAVGFLFIPFFNFIWGIMLLFKTPGLLTKMQLADGIPENQVKHYGHYGWFNLIPGIGGIIWIILTQSAINQYWDKVRHS